MMTYEEVSVLAAMLSVAFSVVAAAAALRAWLFCRKLDRLAAAHMARNVAKGGEGPFAGSTFHLDGVKIAEAVARYSRK